MTSLEAYRELSEVSDRPSSEYEALQTMEIIALEKDRIEREKKEALESLDAELDLIESDGEREMPITNTEAMINLSRQEAMPGQAEKPNINESPESPMEHEFMESDTESDDSTLMYNQSETVYVEDKVYDYDEKKHGVRSVSFDRMIDD